MTGQPAFGDAHISLEKIMAFVFVEDSPVVARHPSGDGGSESGKDKNLDVLHDDEKLQGWCNK